MKMRFNGEFGAGRFSLPSIINLVWRVLQFIGGIVVIAYYASDLRGNQKPDKYSHSRFAFALVVGIFGTLTSFIYGVAGIFIPYEKIAFGFPWEWVLTILWAAVAGLFSSMYLHYHPIVDRGVSRERTAAGFDLANLILWGFSAIAATVMFFMRSKRSMHTGRATV